MSETTNLQAAIPHDETLLVQDEGALVTLTLHRPQVLNALDAALIATLARAFEALASRRDVRCVILTGAGDRAFAAGADIAAMRAMGPDEARALAEAGHRLTLAMEALSVPIIAAVNGFALGGGLELALAADFIYAADTARLGLPEVTLGVIPGLGGTQRLSARIGITRARELIYTGAVLTAARALALGLVNEVHPAAELVPAVRAVATTIASRGPLAVAAAKRALREGAPRPLADALALEAELFAGLFATADQKEGMGAFLEKRKPSFAGR